VLNDAEDDLRNYQLQVEPITSNAGNLGVGAMPGAPVGGAGAAPAQQTTQYADTVGTSEDGRYEESSVQGTDIGSQPPYPVSESEKLEQQQADEMKATQHQPISFQQVA
jgi:hypothetical protein